MPLFNFELAKLEDIAPWGTPPDEHLSWFGLTDGVYYLDVKGSQLFRYSEEIIKQMREKHPNLRDTPFVDYQVVRLWEDILDLVADILVPIPDTLFRLVDTPDSQRNFENSMRTRIDDDSSDKAIELYCTATDWIGRRKLTSLHLREGPNIWFFRDQDEITIRWDNEEKCIDGIQPWAETKGEARYSVTSFMAQVTSFHQRLIDAMETRVKMLTDDNPIPSIRVDMTALVDEQVDRNKWLAAALSRSPEKIDQDKILSAITELTSSKPNSP